MGNSERHFEVKADAGTHFAWLRTRMALDRTLMAAIRTSTALIGFGFTIVQFFERFSSIDRVRDAVFPSAAPRYLGLALIGSGVASLAVFLAMYHSSNTHLWSEEFRAIAGLAPRRKITPASWVAVIVIGVGLFTFAAVVFRAI